VPIAGDLTASWTPPESARSILSSSGSRDRFGRKLKQLVTALNELSGLGIGFI
jgi:hypothetical protein